MRRRDYLLGSAGLMAVTAGCNILGESSAEPTADRLELVTENDNLDATAEEFERGATAIFGAEFGAPVADGEVDYEATVTVLAEGEEIAETTSADSGSAPEDQDVATRQAFVEFQTGDWPTGDHTAEFVVRDLQYDGETDPIDEGFSVVEPTVSVSDLAPTNAAVERGATAEFSATVAKGDGAATDATVTFTVDGESRGSESVTVQPNSEETVEFILDTADMDLGEHDVAVAAAEEELSGTVTVEEPSASLTALSPTNTAVERGATAEFSATVSKGDGVATEVTVEFTVDGDSRGSETVTVQPDAEETVDFDLDTADLSVGDHDVVVSAAGEEIAGILTVERPAPDAVITEELVPAPVLQDTSQDGAEFSATILNDGDAGDVGYALVFTLTQFGDPWESGTESRDVERFDAGEEKQVSQQGRPGAGDEYYTFRVWPAQVRAEVENQGLGDGPVTVELLDDGEVVDTRTENIPAGDSVSVEFRLEAPETKPQNLSVLVATDD